MFRKCSKWFFRPVFLLIILGFSFLVVTIRISSIPLPNNEFLVKIARDLIAKQQNLRDWNDYKLMYDDIRRTGIGEQGKGATLTGDIDRNLEKNLTSRFSFNALLSDAISVHRSVRDLRDEGCFNKKYLTKLPSISIIIPFYNEYFSVFVRTLHSIVNRTPPELLKEIILIDDFSDYENLGKQLDQYVAIHFNKVQIVRLPERTGLIRARLAGVRKATAEVLVILDAHIEVNYNWLPPLLEPIALNKRTVVCPLIDRIAFDNFEYRAVRSDGGGSRGGFDWTFRYASFDLLPEDLVDRTKPYKNPIMIGGLFAITVEFFWELGGYDEGLYIWGGEQYELSFKIWMCGGQLLDAPCSRVGHLFAKSNHRLLIENLGNFVFKNYKRVAEVWMDEYKNYLYSHFNGALDKIDPGNLTTQKAIRERLQCKSFKWFMEEVAFDTLKNNPPIELPDYAYGAIQNVGASHLCVDTLGHALRQKAGLYQCDTNTHIMSNRLHNQKFALSWRRDLRKFGSYTCLDVMQRQKNASVFLFTCHGGGGNQFWYYDRKHKLLINGKDYTHKLCLMASPRDTALYVSTCQKDNPYMQWNFSVINNTAIDSFWENIKK